MDRYCLSPVSTPPHEDLLFCDPTISALRQDAAPGAALDSGDGGREVGNAAQGPELAGVKAKFVR